MINSKGNISLAIDCRGFGVVLGPEVWCRPAALAEVYR
jgi:hypothetical protein